MRKWTSGVLLIALIFFSSGTLAQQDLERRVVKHRLKNGMTFLLLERHTAPTVSFYIFFRVGSAEEQTGKTGLAHLFEHMMFKGTQVVGTKNYAKEKPLMEAIDRLMEQIIAEEARGEGADKKKIERLEQRVQARMEEQRRWMIPDEFDEIYERNGGSTNAFTSNDFTGYVVSLPSNKLRLWMAMEADRMKRPVLREFYSERDVVMEERRLNTETSPEGKLDEEFLAAAFTAHPYGVPIIGWMADLRRLTRKDAEEFFRRHYGPNNAVASLVGDFKVQEVIPLIEKYFAAVPASPLPKRYPTTEPPQSGERRVTVEFDAQPMLRLGFHKPTYPHPDNYVFDVIEAVLGRGRTSRLYRHLVEGQGVALDADASNNDPGDRYANLFVISATPKAPRTAEELERAVDEELEKLKQEPVSEKELERVRNQVDADLVRALDSNSGMAYRLGYYETVLGDWRFMTRYPQNIRKVSAEDIRRVARQYFVPRNRTVAVLVTRGGKMR